MKIKNILCGPFIGDFKTEILDFRPYTRWVYEVLKPERMFVATHSNRCFLYEWATTLPVFEDLSRDELGQNGVLHNSIGQKDVSSVIKKAKEDVINILKSKEDVIHINLHYSKSHNWCPIYKKIYTPIKYSKNKGKIVFIPDINEKYAFIEDVYEFLQDEFDDVVIVGDMKTHLHGNNIIYKDNVNFTDMYNNIINHISNAKVVITPNSHWTVLSNIQNKPVFSWGTSTLYYEHHKNDMILPNNIPFHNLKNMLSDFIKKNLKNSK